MSSPGVRETIQRFHERHAGISSGFFTRMRSVDGRTSYDRIVDEVVDTAPAPRVLDLGCGDGALLDAIAERDRSAVLSGIDFSTFELDLARRRLPSATLCVGDLHESFPFADGSFDAVISHMVLMLVGELDDVFSSVARVLRPGGRFIFVVDALDSEPNGYTETLRDALTATGILPQPARFDTASDARLRDEARLRSLLDAHRLTVRSSERFATTGPADEEFCVGLILGSYPLGIADDNVRAVAARHIRQWFERQGRGIDTPLQLYVAERR